MRTETVPTTGQVGRVGAPAIVVGVDGRPRGWYALEWAADEAVATGAELTICHAGPPVPPDGQAVLDTLELVDPVFARFVREARRKVGGHRVALRFVPGEPATVLCDATHGAGMLVIGAPSPVVFGGDTAERVLARAECPVVVIRPVASGQPAPFAGHVVVALAGASIDPLALDFGFRYAEAHRIPLAAVHVGAASGGDYWFDERTLETHFVTEPPALGVVAAAVEPMLPRYPGVPAKLGVLAGQPVTRILDAAQGARLTVIGRRHTRLTARLLGSVSRGVLAGAPGPVAVVPLSWRGWAAGS